MINPFRIASPPLPLFFGNERNLDKWFIETGFYRKYFMRPCRFRQEGLSDNRSIRLAKAQKQ